MQLKVFINNEWLNVNKINTDDFWGLISTLNKKCRVAIDDVEFEIRGNFLYEDLKDLLDKIDFIESEYSEYEEEAFKALIEYYGNYKKAYDCWLKDEYTYYPDVNTKYGLGYYIVHDDLGTDISDFIFKYFDYEALGDEVASNGKFVKTGFITVY